MSDPTKLTFVSRLIPTDAADFWRWYCKHCPADSYVLGEAGKFRTEEEAQEAGEAHPCSHEWDSP